MDVAVIDMDTPMDIQPRIRIRDSTNLDEGPIDYIEKRQKVEGDLKRKFNIDEPLIKNPIKRRRFDEDPYLPPYVPDSPNLDQDVSLLQNLLTQMKRVQTDQNFGLSDTPGGVRERQLPWGHIIFKDSFTGPANDMGPYSLAVREGPLAQASWEHDWLVSSAKGNVELLQQIDQRYLEQVKEMDLDPLIKYFITESIQYGAPIYYKIRSYFE